MSRASSSGMTTSAPTIGDYYGVRLGYGQDTGFGPYGLSGDQRNHLREQPVFGVREVGTFTTRNVFAGELGIDVTPGRKPSLPAPLSR